MRRTPSPSRARLLVLAVLATLAGLGLPAPAGAAPAPARPIARYDTSFGFSGPAGLYAYGLDWDASTDTLLVGDYWNYRIKRFHTSGTKASPFIVSATRPAGVPGGTTAPYDVEADLSDRVGGRASLWSADQGSSRIVQFTQDGHYLQTIGLGGGGTDAAHPGADHPMGCGGGRMTVPTHLYADPRTGTLYVSDPACRAVWMFNHTGTFLGSLDWAGSGIGQVVPRGLAAGPDGRLYVVEFSSRSVNAFDKNGHWLRRVVTQSDMNDPRGLDIDQRNGDIVVVAAYRNEVFTFSPKGVLLKRWGTTGGPSRPSSQAFDAIRFPAVDGDGNIYVGETWGSRRADGTYTGYRVLKFTSAGQPLPFATGPAGPPDGGYNQQNGLAIDRTGALFVVDTFEQRVQKLDTTSTCLAAGSCPAWELQFGSRESAGPQSQGFGYPRALTYSSVRDLIYVGDNNNAVLAFTRDGRFVHRFGSQGTGAGQFLGGVQGVEASGGRIYTTDIGTCRLDVWDESRSLAAGTSGGTLTTSMGSCGHGANQMAAPRGIAVGDAGGNPGTVYVAETGDSRISRWDVATRTATVLRPVCAGSGLLQPWGITWDPSRTWLYIGDVGGARIVRISPDGRTCQVVTTGADVPEGALKGSNYLAFDAQGRLYASDNNRRVYRFTLPATGAASSGANRR